MSVYLDPPRWERHGTMWGHVVSDVSLAELHAVAARAGLSARGFDLDHYDYPVVMRSALLAAGVREVDNHELVRLLIAAGLRVRARDRRTAHRAWLETTWDGPGPAPQEVLRGPIGHTALMPERAGAFRLEQEADGHRHIRAHDAAGEGRAREVLAHLDAVARGNGESHFVGMVTGWDL